MLGYCVSEFSYMIFICPSKLLMFINYAPECPLCLGRHNTQYFFPSQSWKVLTDNINKVTLEIKVINKLLSLSRVVLALYKRLVARVENRTQLLA